MFRSLLLEGCGSVKRYIYYVCYVETTHGLVFDKNEFHTREVVRDEPITQFDQVRKLLPDSAYRHYKVVGYTPLRVEEFQVDTWVTTTQ